MRRLIRNLSDRAEFFLIVTTMRNRPFVSALVAHAAGTLVVVLALQEPEWLRFEASMIALALAWAAMFASSIVSTRKGARATMLLPVLSASAVLFLTTTLFDGSISPHPIAAPAVVVLYVAWFFWPSLIGIVVGMTRGRAGRDSALRPPPTRAT
jgi:hypothetical protein